MNPLPECWLLARKSRTWRVERDRSPRLIWVNRTNFKRLGCEVEYGSALSWSSSVAKTAREYLLSTLERLHS